MKEASLLRVVSDQEMGDKQKQKEERKWKNWKLNVCFLKMSGIGEIIVSHNCLGLTGSRRTNSENFFKDLPKLGDQVK